MVNSRPTSAGDRFMVTAIAGTISHTAVGAQSLAKCPMVKGSSSEGPERRVASAAISAGGGMALVVAARGSLTTQHVDVSVDMDKLLFSDGEVVKF